MTSPPFLLVKNLTHRSIRGKKWNPVLTEATGIKSLDSILLDVFYTQTYIKNKNNPRTRKWLFSSSQMMSFHVCDCWRHHPLKPCFTDLVVTLCVFSSKGGGPCPSTGQEGRVLWMQPPERFPESQKCLSPRPLSSSACFSGTGWSLTERACFCCLVCRDFLYSFSSS